MLHWDVEALGDPADLLPHRRCVSPKRTLLRVNVEPPWQSHRFAPEKRFTLARCRKDISLRTADLVGRAAALNEGDTERLGSGHHRNALGGSDFER